MPKRPVRRVAPKPDPVLQAYARALSASRWQRRNPQMWAQARRLGKLLSIQQGADGQEFPAGCCFLHAALPTVNSFCVRRVVEVDLEACTVTLAIHADEELAAGHVVLPLEAIGWLGFPDQAVGVGVRFHGFGDPGPLATPVKTDSSR